MRLSESPVEPRHSPLYGEPTADVLRSLAGHAPEEIEALRKKGVIAHT